MTCPHDDHATNDDHKLTALGNIVTATSSGNVELFDIKRIIVSFLWMEENESKICERDMYHHRAGNFNIMKAFSISYLVFSISYFVFSV